MCMKMGSLDKVLAAAVAESFDKRLLCDFYTLSHKPEDKKNAKHLQD